MKKQLQFIPFAILSLGLAACGGGSSSSTPDTPDTPVDTNNAPTATNDSASATLGEALTIDVLANDTDSDGDSLTISEATASDGGTVTIENNALSYTS
ncbi:Ig-like domain-containing protein, partial [Thalassotalea ganghwensis]